MLSVHKMLNNSKESNYKRPSVLDINNLLCSDQQKSPSLSPSLTSSPASISSYSTTTTTTYSFPIHQQSWNINRRHHSTSSSSSDFQFNTIKQQQYIDISLKNNHQNMMKDDDIVQQQEDDDDDDEDDYEDDDDSHMKAKRRRANVKQLEVLNRVFNRTFFPSTQMRTELGRQLGMSPRTVQIWFQNRRQAMRTRERQRLIKLRNNHETTAK